MLFFCPTVKSLRISCLFPWKMWNKCTCFTLHLPFSLVNFHFCDKLKIFKWTEGYVAFYSLFPIFTFQFVNISDFIAIHLRIDGSCNLLRHLMFFLMVMDFCLIRKKLLMQFLFNLNTLGIVSVSAWRWISIERFNQRYFTNEAFNQNNNRWHAGFR